MAIKKRIVSQVPGLQSGQPMQPIQQAQSTPQQATQSPGLLGSIGLGLFDAAINKPFIQPIGTALEGARAWGLNFQKPDDMVLQSAMNKKNKNQPLTYDEQKALEWNDKMLGYQPQFMSEKRFNEIGNENAAVTGLKQGLLTGSALLPGASSAVGGIGRAAASGAMYGAGETSDWSNIPELAQNTVVGGLMGGATEGLLQGVSKGIGKMSGGKGLGGALKNKAQNIEKGMLDVSKLERNATSLADKQQMVNDIYEIVKSEAPEIKFGRGGEFTIPKKEGAQTVKFNRKESLKAAQEVAYSRLSKKFGEMVDGELGDTPINLQTIEANIDSIDTLDPYYKSLLRSQGVTTQPMTKTMSLADKVNEIRDSLSTQFPKSDFDKQTGVLTGNLSIIEQRFSKIKTVRDAVKAKRSLQQFLKKNKVFETINKDGDGAVKPAQRVQLEAWRFLDNLISNTSPELKDISKKMSKVHIASEDLADFLNKKGDGVGLAAFIYTPRFETTGGVMGMKGWAADQLNTLGNAIEGTPATTKRGQIAQSATSQLPARSVAAGAVNDLTGEHATPIDMGQDTGATDTQDTGTGGSGTQGTFGEQGFGEQSYGNQSPNNVSLMDEYKQNQQVRMQGMLYLMSKGMKVTEAKAIVDFMSPELNIDQMMKIREFEQKQSATQAPELFAGERGQIAALRTAGQIVDEIESAYNELGKSNNKVAAAVGGITLGNRYVGSEAGLNYAQKIDSLRATLARTLGNVGNLTDQEQANALKNIPTIQDTPKQAARKLKDFRNRLRLSEQSIVGAAQDFPS